MSYHILPHLTTSYHTRATDNDNISLMEDSVLITAHLANNKTTVWRTLIQVSHLGIFADFLVDNVDGRHLKVHDVDGHLGKIGLLQVPAESLYLLQTPRLNGDRA